MGRKLLSRRNIQRSIVLIIIVSIVSSVAFSTVFVGSVMANEFSESGDDSVDDGLVVYTHSERTVMEANNLTTNKTAWTLKPSNKYDSINARISNVQSNPNSDIIYATVNYPSEEGSALDVVEINKSTGEIVENVTVTKNYDTFIYRSDFENNTYYFIVNETVHTYTSNSGVSEQSEYTFPDNLYAFEIGVSNGNVNIFTMSGKNTGVFYQNGEQVDEVEYSGGYQTKIGDIITAVETADYTQDSWLLKHKNDSSDNNTITLKDTWSQDIGEFVSVLGVTNYNSDILVHTKEDKIDAGESSMYKYNSTTGERTNLYDITSEIEDNQTIISSESRFVESNNSTMVHTITEVRADSIDGSSEIIYTVYDADANEVTYQSNVPVSGMYQTDITLVTNLNADSTPTTDTPTENTPNDTDNTTPSDETTESPGQPGFGIVVAIVSLLGAAILAHRRD